VPIYEYACSACEHEFETLQGFSEDPLLFCPECGKESLHKKLSAAAFHLKGTGWYETDFKDQKKDADGDSTSADDSAGDKNDSAGSTDKAASDKSKKSETADKSDSTGGDGKGKAKKSKSSGKKTAGKSKSNSGGSRQSAA